MELNKAQALCLELMNKHGLTKEKGWKFEWINSKRAAGRCRTFGGKKVVGYTRNGARMYAPTNTTNGGTIMLSNFITQIHTDEQVLDTILHEIAHGLTPGHGHDYVWKSKAVEIGCNGKRCYEMSDDLKEAKMATSKYVGTCPKCNHEFPASKIPNGDRWHSKCAFKILGKYKQEEKIIYTLNVQEAKAPIVESRSFQQFMSTKAGHTSFPNTLLNQAPDSYKGMLDKFEREFLGLPAMLNETRGTFENIVMKAKTSSSSWRTMNREVRKACNVWIVENGYMTNKEFQEKFFYEGVMIGRTTWGKNAPWAGKFEGYELPKAA